MHGAVIVIRERRGGIDPGDQRFGGRPGLDRPSGTSDMPCQSADEPVTQTRSLISRHNKLPLA